MKKLLNTFFFGYPSLKWRRLIRTIITITYLPFVIFTYIEVLGKTTDFEGRTIGEFHSPYFILFISIPIVSIALISWVIKPFVVK